MSMVRSPDETTLTAAKESPSLHPELLEHHRLVELLPALRDSAVDEVIEDQPIDRDRSPGRRQRSERTRVRAAAVPARDHRVAHDYLFLDGERQIGESSE